MKKLYKSSIAPILATALLLGLVTITVTGYVGAESKDKDYTNIQGDLNNAIKSLKLGNNPSSALKNARNQYKNLTSEEAFNDSEVESLDNQIRTNFDSLVNKGKQAKISSVQNLKSEVSEMGGNLEANLPLAYQHSALVILGFSISLAYLASLLCRKLIDWDALEETKNKMKDWKKRIQEARRKKGKKKRKLELEKDEAINHYKKTWQISFSQALIYLALFFLFLGWLGLVYGDWIVVWLPFDWFASGTLGWIGVSLGLLGWFIFSYFTFAQVFRELILSERADL